MHQIEEKNKPFKHALVWLRRDLRLQDHPALYEALNEAEKISIAFIFDTTILQYLPKNDRRLTFIWQSLIDIEEYINKDLGENNGLEKKRILCLHGDPIKCIPQLVDALKIDAVYSHEDYEPSAITRDGAIEQQLSQKNVAFKQCRDHVLAPHDQIFTQQQKVYTVFSPYKKAVLNYLAQHPENLRVAKIEPQQLMNQWLSKKEEEGLFEKQNSNPKLINLIQPSDLIDLKNDPMERIGFEMQSLLILAGRTGAQKLWLDFQNRLDYYHQSRDFPSIKGVSYLSVHLRFGTIGIRELGEYTHALLPASIKDKTGASTWFSELLWHDFFSYILYHFPHVAEGKSFNPIYQNLPWSSNTEHFKAWCEGKTGFTIVDAGMRQLNQTGYMHNRLRMICASFLVKDLGIDWRWGEAYFAEQLLDFDFASNNGGWQWAASTGCDAQPYFRIFNPHLQGAKFDEDGRFIKRYIPELEKLAALNPMHLHDLAAVPPAILQEIDLVLGRDYPKPLIEHKVEKEKTLRKFEAAAKAAKV